MAERNDTAEQIANQQEFDATELAEAGSDSFEKMTVSNTAIAFANVPTDAHKAIVTVEGNDVRYRLDGDTSAPTATDGMPIAAGQTVAFVGALARVRFIRKSADATLQITYFA